MKNPALPASRSLRRTVLIVLGVGFLLLSAAQYYFSGDFLHRELQRIETQAAQERLHSARQALQALRENLDATGSDWSNWDSTYNFVTHRNPTYVDDNLTAASLRRLHLNLVIVVDEDGKVAFAKTLLNPDGELQDAPADIVALCAAGGRLIQGRGLLSGLIATSIGPVMVTSQPVFDSPALKPPKGRLIMGRSLNDTLVASLSRIAAAPLTVEPVGALHELTADSRYRSVHHLEDGDTLYLGNGTIDGHAILRGLWQEPAAVLHVHLERPLQTTLSDTRRYLLAITLGVGLAFCIVALLFVKSRVIEPIERLARSLAGIGTTGSTSGRVEESYVTAELQTLSRSINEMLGQIEQQQNLRKDRDAALEATRLKSEFLATMSHEIRTPMNGVLGMCELLQRTDLNPKQRHLSDTLLRSARSLLGILNDILDFSKIESGKLQLEAAPFSPVEVLQNVSAPFVAAAQAKSVTFVTQVDGNVPSLAIGDALCLRQVLNNLLGNALKFTAHGSVTLGCIVSRSDDCNVVLRIDVTDTGIGIPAEAQGNIFNAFAQAEASTSRRFGGTGLGLAIVRRLVDLMGGEVGVESTLGQGSRFWFTVKLQRSASSPAGLPVPAAELRTGARFSVSHAPTVLLAEDNTINREVLTEMLESLGCRVTAVQNGAQAVAAVAAHSFDAILMDCQMPILDGQAATVELRSLERETARPRTFIIALTADATAENRERCLEAGMDSVVTKPISHARLRDLLLHAVRPVKTVA